MDIFEILTYDTAEVENVAITTTDPDWTDLMTLVAVDRVPGKYALSFSLQFLHATTSQSFFYRFSLDGGTTWGLDYEKEVKDRHNTEIIEVFNMIEHTGGDIELAVQVTREGSANCNVIKGIITVERKG